MEVEQDRPVPLGTLCARMRLLLDLFGHEGALRGAWWSGVANLLLPPACVSGIETNASAADLYNGWAYCSAAADYDDGQSILLNDYMSVLARFYFVWSAYEAVRRQSDAGRLLTSKDVGGRTILAGRVPPAQLELLNRVYRMSLASAQENKTILKSLKKRDEGLVVGKAGLIAAEFRNYTFHGNEALPTPDDWNGQFRARLAGDDVVSLQAYRMVCFTRLTFHLIQTLTHAELRRGYEVEIGYVPFLPWRDCEFGVPSGFVLNLATCWPEERPLRLSSRALKHLAAGCDRGAR